MAATRVSASPYPTEKPCRVSTARPAAAMSTAIQVSPVIRLPSSTAANSGVATTYIPVMKPDTLAGVWARPAVCRICATPYSAPSTTAWRRAADERRATARGATASSSAPAIENRTARKSSVGTRSSRSWIKKNVEPQQAVMPSRAAVASSVVRLIRAAS